MFFNLESDNGDRVVGYVAPDGFSSVPNIRVCGRGRVLAAFPCNEKRESLVVAGRHETGQCGFAIDDALVPGLRNIDDLEVYDADNNLLVYRRPRADNIKRKLVRVETHLFPLWALDRSIAPRFQYFAKGIEDLGRETVTQMFLLNLVDSVYLSGRILYRNYAYFIESGFETLVMLHDPHSEMAERLLVLGKIRKVGSAHLGLRESAALEPAMRFAESLPMDDEKALRRELRHMPENVMVLLANPLVRQLTSTTPDEMPTGAAVASALDILASSVLVGLRRDSGKFIAGLGELLGVEAASLAPVPSFPPVAPFARLLKESGAVDALLEKDLELYHYVEQAANKAPP